MLVPPLPRATVKLVGEAVSVKLPNAVTVNVTVVVAFRVPDVPVMVIVAVPAFAVVPAVRVRVLVEVAGLGLNEAVTPFGNTELVNVTLPANPFTGVTVMVLVPLAPLFAMVTELGEEEMVKLCAKVFTVRLRVVVFVNVPDTPEIVTVTVPVVAVALAVKVSKLVPVAGLGLKSAVTPLGRFKAERVTLPLKPSSGVMVMVLVPWLPCVMVTLPGFADNVKFGPAGPANALIRPEPFGLPHPVGKS